MFYDCKKENIQEVWRLPTNEEILTLPVDEDEMRKLNPFIKKAPTVDDFIASVDTSKALEYLKPILTKTTDPESITKATGRLVFFKEAFPYKSHAFKFLRYWRAAADIFDIEFFINKLQCTAFVLSSIEKQILCGLPFWDSGGGDLVDLGSG